MLAQRPEIAGFSYPGLAQGREGEVARRQMSAGGGLISFELSGGMQAGKDFMNALEVAHRAVSLGDAETLVRHPASMTHSTYGAEERARYGISDGLIRVSVGLENSEDIVEDFAAALDVLADR